MANVKLVDSEKLDAALTATANAIRAKTGDASQLTFDFSGQTGFKTAVEAITGGGGGAYDILATITGDTQTLAITDASGGSGIFHDSGTVAYHTGANVRDITIPIPAGEYDHLIIEGHATNCWLKVDNVWTEQASVDFSSLTAGKAAAVNFIMDFVISEKSFGGTSVIAQTTGAKTTNAFYGAFGHASYYDATVNNAAATTAVTVGTDDITFQSPTVAYACSMLIGMTYSYDVWGWND